jgi:cobalamin biosynthesis protein CobC
MEEADSGPKTEDALLYHGGNLGAAMRRFPQAPTPWVDLSTGINPVPYPIGVLPEATWSRLPEPADDAALEAAARGAYGVPDGAAMTAAPGTQALIQWLPRLFPAERVGVWGFTYQEHEACWRRAGASVTVVADLPALEAFDAGVVVNPNNPDGRIVTPAALVALAGSMHRRGARLIVDEAFMDFEPAPHSLIPSLPAPGALVLRSFGKTYGLAGLRLGFAVGSRDDCAVLRGAIGPWAVSGPAIHIGRRALMDAAWRAAAAARLRNDTARLDAVLRRAGFDIVGGTALFRLARHPRAAMVFESLCRSGILARPFRDRPELLRFGMPRGDGDWTRLAHALTD